MRAADFAFTVVFLISCTGTQDGEGSLGATVGGESTHGESMASAVSGSSTVDSTTADTGSQGEGPKLDLAVPDAGGSPGVGIPATCAEAQAAQTSVGCEFFAVDLDQHDVFGEDLQFAIAIAIANVHVENSAHVVVEVRNAGIWEEAVPSVEVGALELAILALPERHQEDSGHLTGGGYRVSSDVPVVAVQFNPLTDSQDTSGASLLYPTAAWGETAEVVGLKSTVAHPFTQSPMGAYLALLAAEDGTTVTVTPSVATLAGVGVPAGSAGMPFMVDLDEGDVVAIMGANEGEELTGTRLTANAPISLYSGHECVTIPELTPACDHVAEHLPAPSSWGKNFIAARLPPRDADPPEAVFWQIYAKADRTVVTLDAAPEVTGLPVAPVVLDAGEQVQFFVTGNSAVPGDFSITATEALLVVQYMSGADATTSGEGDPAMVHLAPIEQFLTRYVVLVPPDSWTFDYAVITREVDREVTRDGVAVDSTAFVATGNGYEVARVLLEDGVHVFEGEAPFGVIVAGFRSTDAYAYLAGSGTSVLDPEG